MNLEKFAHTGKFLMLAFDHRGSIKKLMNPTDPESITDEQVIDLKTGVIKSIFDQVSGLLVDQEYGLKAYKSVATGSSKPFLLPVEKSGYTDSKGERTTELEYSIPELRAQGASGAKILLYFNPNLDSAQTQLDTAKKVLDECKKNNFPLFLEIVTYQPNGKDSLKMREGLVLNSLKMFKQHLIFPDVYKLEYPGSLEACEKITQLLGDTPWIILTRGDTFDLFTQELKDAIQGGARGFLAGRALWQEVCSLDGERKEIFLNKILPERFKEISDIARG